MMILLRSECMISMIFSSNKMKDREEKNNDNSGRQKNAPTRPHKMSTS